MICMAALAPKGIFEEEEIAVCRFEEEKPARHFDDYSRDCDAA